MNIVLAIQDLGIGGAERQVVELASGLQRRGHIVSICCLNRLGPLCEETQTRNITVDCLHKKHRYDLSIIYKLARYLTAKKADVLQTFLFGADFWGRLAGRLAGIKVLLTSERAGGIYSEKYEIWADRLLSSLSDGVIANTSVGCKMVTQIGWVHPTRVFLIPNGIDLSKYDNLPNRLVVRKQLNIGPKTFVVAYCGSVKPIKNPQMMVAVAENLNKKNMDFIILVIGAGVSLSDIKTNVNAKGLSDKFLFLGNRLDVPGLLVGADAGLLCSQWEGFPNAIMDYMATRLPLVVTDVGGIRDLVIQDKTGFIVPVNAPEMMAERLMALAQNKVLSKTVGLEGRKRLEDNFEQGVLAQKIESLYNMILLEKGKA